jgi:hypothetical protein
MAQKGVLQLGTLNQIFDLMKKTNLCDENTSLYQIYKLINGKVCTKA